MQKIETVGTRFTQLISHLGISKNAFAASLDKTATVIQHLVDERNKPGFDLLCKVFEVYPNVSKDWLLTGTGPMLTDAPPTSVESLPRPAAKPATVVEADSTPLALVADAPPAAAPAATSPETAPPVEKVAMDFPPVAPPSSEAAAAPAATGTVAVVPPTPDSNWQAALYTQQMAHQLALADLRNQHLLEQQRLMQQMLDLMQRQLVR
ncbi:hypothetical protein [Hymenobacter persicinus]|uniref:XRE family transcriptional regulator n=1 Tax=Hymenobacter persicinus TaxID=2025506 RepID=A0A4Q5LEV0_9BACT|nr:hypothetical protein [Hymenobacter persicinus]RYU83226.1 hypothetical protein EWM57_02770 [Hymenobacter persicinus]